MANFGETIRRARLQQGWDQAELARRIGVGQQTVSRWERGDSRPRIAVVNRVADLLGLDAASLRTSAGYGAATADAPSSVRRPVRPLVPHLPFDELPPDRFEQFSADLAKALYPAYEVHRYGGQGHKQGGVDVLVRPQGLAPIGIQCKREKEFGPAKVRDAVAALEIDVHKCYIYLTRIASPDARKEISKHPRWEIWDIDDMSRAVRSLSDQDAKIRLVDTYFPQWREPFLGVSQPGPWLTPDEFFLPFSGDRIYTHD